jgi:hypothetical protein
VVCVFQLGGFQLSSIGTIAENLLASIVSDPLLIDFVHLRPKRGSKDDELCDLLIEDEPKALVVQLKTQDVEQAKPNRDPQRWARKYLKEASRQVKGALRCLPRQDIISDPKYPNPVRGPVTFPKGSLIGCHGLVIIDYSYSPFKIDEKLPSITDNLTPMHYLSYEDFILLCQHLMTLPDLIQYLDQRANIAPWEWPMLNDEKNAYAYYIMRRNTFDPTTRANDFDGEWQRLTTKYAIEYQEKLHEDQKAELFTKMLHHIHNTDPDLLNYIPDSLKSLKPLNVNEITEIARKLNRFTRLDRRYISERMMRKLRLADQSPWGFNYFAHQSQAEGPPTTFVFLASRHPRKERIEQLHRICECVNNTIESDFVIGASTESLQISEEKGNSFDFFMLDDSTREKDPEVVENCRKLFSQTEMVQIHDFPRNE